MRMGDGKNILEEPLVVAERFATQRLWFQSHLSSQGSSDVQDTPARRGTPKYLINTGLIAKPEHKSSKWFHYEKTQWEPASFALKVGISNHSNNS